MPRLTVLAALATTTALGLALPGAPAHAECVQTGTDVSCAADDFTGFASGDDNLTITVDPGVSVENDAGDAMELHGADGVTVNTGADSLIFSSFNRGIDLDTGDDATITNNGLIDSGDDAIRGDDGITVINETDGVIFSLNERGVRAGDDLTVTNRGLIDAGNDAVSGDNNVTVTNTVDGVLFSEFEEGIDALNDLTVINDGVVDGGDEGIQAGLRATITNGATGEILGFDDDAIQVQGDAQITNSGLIESLESDGIDIDSGTVTNTATGEIVGLGGTPEDAGIDVDAIEAVDGELPVLRSVTIDNAGLILGEVGILVDSANTETQDIINSGAIVGLGGTALSLGGGEDSLTLLDDALIAGIADFGDDDDVLDLSGVTSRFAGAFGAFFDGGDGIDTIAIDIAGLTLDDITVFAAAPGFGPDAFRLGFFNSAGTTTTVFFEDFELFDLDGTTFSAADIAAVAPVPLPAGVVLMLSAFGLFGLLGRRRAA